jgi:hypothetical protein
VADFKLLQQQHRSTVARQLTGGCAAHAARANAEVFKV